MELKGPAIYQKKYELKPVARNCEYTEGKYLNAVFLEHVQDIELDDKGSVFSEIEFVVVSDARIPLLGEFGQAQMFGPQKGCSEEQIEKLEAGYQNIRDIWHQKTGVEVDCSWAGASGGIGSMFKGLLNAVVLNGAEFISGYTVLHQEIDTCDIVLTGEGKYDNSTFLGKTPYYVALVAATKNVPVISFVGVSSIETKMPFNTVVATTDIIDANNIQSEEIKTNYYEKMLNYLKQMRERGDL